MYGRELAAVISRKLEDVSKAFGQAQKSSGLNCPEACAKCCLKADISCAPVELLPMAFHLIDQGRGEVMLEKARQHNLAHCLFLNVKDVVLGSGACSEYEHRPFICRAFGLSARHGKNEILEYSLCKTLRSKSVEENIELRTQEIPFIESWKKQLETLDPHFLEKEVPIHVALTALLEKLLLIESFKN